MIDTNPRLNGEWRLDQWVEFAKTDKCLEGMVPSDLRQILGFITRTLKEQVELEKHKEIYGKQIDDEQAQKIWKESTDAIASVKYAYGKGLEAGLAYTPRFESIRKCTCTDPIIKCDHRGCRCQMCGELA